METKIFIGILLIGLGAFSSGSFAVPFRNIKNWRWETYWMIYSFGAYLVFPLLAAFLFAPGSITVIHQVPMPVLITVFLLGVVYGVGNLSFGLALRYLGLSLGYALSLGIMLAIGTLIPPALDGRLNEMMQDKGGLLLIFGIVIAIIGIALSAWSGIAKDKQVSESNKLQSVQEYNLTKGIIAALLVGITGSAMSLGFEQANPISEVARQNGINTLFTMMPVMVVLLTGTFVTTFIWCIYLGYKNGSLKNYISAGSRVTLRVNYLFGLLAGLLWFSQFILYGMGKSKMGPFTFTSWGILMALTIAFATVWGILKGEWKGISLKVWIVMVVSLLVIIGASFMIGISGSE